VRNVLITALPVPGPVVRVDVIAYSPTEFLEETDVTIGRGRELVEKFAVTWINIVDPDTRTLQELETLFGLHTLPLEDSIRPDTPPKVETYGDVLFAVTRTIIWGEQIETDQLSVFLAKKYLITIHDKIYPQLEDVRVRIRRRAPRILKAGPDYLCYTILDVLVDSYFPHLDRLEDIIQEIERELIDEPRKVNIEKIHAIRTDLLLLRNALRPQRDAFTTITRLELPYFKKETRNYLRDVYDHMIRTLDTLDTYREIVTSLMEVQTTLVSNQINQVIKVLTVIFTVTLPLTIITSAYGMNVSFPGFGTEIGFFLAIVLMAGTTAAMVWYMRKRFWI